MAFGLTQRNATQTIGTQPTAAPNTAGPLTHPAQYFDIFTSSVSTFYSLIQVKLISKKNGSSKRRMAKGKSNYLTLFMAWNSSFSYSNAISGCKTWYFVQNSRRQFVLEQCRESTTQCTSIIPTRFRVANLFCVVAE